MDDKGKGILSEVGISDRAYFISAMQGNAVITNVLMSRIQNQYVIIVAAPLWEGGVQNSNQSLWRASGRHGTD